MKTSAVFMVLSLFSDGVVAFVWSEANESVRMDGVCSLQVIHGFWQDVVKKMMVIAIVLVIDNFFIMLVNV
jgi:hypothetical protein